MQSLQNYSPPTEPPTDDEINLDGAVTHYYEILIEHGYVEISTDDHHEIIYLHETNAEDLIDAVSDAVAKAFPDLN